MFAVECECGREMQTAQRAGVCSQCGRAFIIDWVPSSMPSQSPLLIKVRPEAI